MQSLRHLHSAVLSRKQEGWNMVLSVLVPRVRGMVTFKTWQRRPVRAFFLLCQVEEERQRLNATTVSRQAFFDGSAGAGPRTLGSSWRALRADGIRDTPAIPHAACGNCNRDTASQDMLSCKQWTRDEEGEPQPVQCLRLFCRDCEHYEVTFDDQ